MSDYFKSENVLKRNLDNLYSVLIALCDKEVKNQGPSIKILARN